MQILNTTYKEDQECFSFNFTFDRFSSDNCIVYNKKNPFKWACNGIYIKTGIHYRQIQNAILHIIDSKGRV